MTEGNRALVELELKRKAFHLLGLLYLGAYWLIGHPLVNWVMGSWMALVAALETLRLVSPGVRGALHSVFGPIIREKEAARFTGAFYTSLGAFSVFLLYGARPAVVAAAILYLSLGDAASAVVGRLWGRRAYAVLGERRTLEGSAAGLAAALACGWLAGLSPAHAAAGALAFLAADTVPIPPDDNLWIPVLAGGTLFVLGA